jgi:hypothetical protein
MSVDDRVVDVTTVPCTSADLLKAREAVFRAAKPFRPTCPCAECSEARSRFVAALERYEAVAVANGRAAERQERGR